jgi:hypothetical protein
MTLETGDHRCAGRLIGLYHIAQVLGIELRDTSVVTRSTNIILYRPTVTAALGSGPAYKPSLWQVRYAA